MNVENVRHIKQPLAPPKPTHIQAIKAVGYWVLFDDLAVFFEKSNMPVVHRHLTAACQEIDRIWVEGDYDKESLTGYQEQL